MSGAYTSGIVQTHHGVWFKHGHMPMNLSDGYQLIETTHPHAIGQVRATPDGTLWLWSGTSLQRFSSGSWNSYAVPEVTSLGVLQNDTTQTWRFVSKQRPGLSAPFGLAPLSRNRVLILLPDRILEFDASRGRASPVLLSGETALGSFLELRSRKSGGIWITGGRGLGTLVQAQAGHWVWSWSGRPSPPAGFSAFKELIEEDNGDLLVVATARCRPPVAWRMRILRFSGGHWSEIYSSESSTLRAWPGVEGSFWIQDGNQIVELVSDGSAHPVDRLNALSGIVLSTHFEKDGTFWLGTTQGVARYAPPLWRPPAGLNSRDQVVNAITEDRLGRLWFAGASALICFDNQRWRTYPLPKGQESWTVFTESLAPLPDGRIALRTTSPDLVTVRSANGPIRNHQTSGETEIIRLFVAHPEGLLVQTCPPGNRSMFRLEIYNGRAFRTILPHGTVEGTDDLRTIWLDRSGDVWAGHITGFRVYHNGKFARQGAGQGFTDSGCFVIYQAPSGVIYAGGRDSLFVRNGDSWRSIRTGLDRARSIVAAHDGALWVASGNGVHRYRNGTWLSNGPDEGLASNVVYRLFEDSRGRIWAGTTRGISLYHPEADLDPPTTFISSEQNLEEAPGRRSGSHGVLRARTSGSRLFPTGCYSPGAWMAARGHLILARPVPPTFKHLSAGRRRF